MDIIDFLQNATEVKNLPNRYNFYYNEIRYKIDCTKLSITILREITLSDIMGAINGKAPENHIHTFFVPESEDHAFNLSLMCIDHIPYEHLGTYKSFISKIDVRCLSEH
ncbi:hypothetical protein XaC1_449 [Xanthomonas phage XaC1]|nr:hypothetical protein XaC1_449 [Xanthomonas phage XaC1]